MDLDTLQKLNELKEKGVITEDEFQQQKEKILNQPVTKSTTGLDFHDVRIYSMFMHLSQLFAFVLPVLGWVVPLVMWLTRKEEESINQQGKVIFNWILSALIYGVVSILLIMVLIGIPLLIALVVCTIVFAIMGALRAKEGMVKNYPLAIRFFSVEESKYIEPK